MAHVTYEWKSYSDTEQYKNVYHRKVLTEKVIRHHTELADEFGWISSIRIPSFGSNSGWRSYDMMSWESLVKKYDYIPLETKPHLTVSEPVRKAITKNPPVLTKKFGQYSNLSKRHGGFHHSRSFSRKAF